MAGSATGKWVIAIQRPLFAKFKKHECAKCGSQLQLVKIKQCIEKGSPESIGKGIRFSMISHHPVDYIFSIFECTNCGNKLSINDQYFIEKPYKKNKLQYDDYHQYLQSLDRQNGTNEYSSYLESLKGQKHN